MIKYLSTYYINSKDFENKTTINLPIYIMNSNVNMIAVT